MSRRCIHSRHAWSLIEMMVVISGCTVILTTSAALIHRTMRARADSQSFLDVERNANRLSAQFRADVHQATAAAVGDGSSDGVLLRLEFPEQQRVEYRAVVGSVVRTLSFDGRPKSRDHFAFDSASQIEVRELETPRRLVLTIASAVRDAQSPPPRRAAGYAATPVALRVEASMNRNGGRSATSTGEEPLP